MISRGAWFVVAALTALALMTGAGRHQADDDADKAVSEADAYEIGVEAYTYFYPLVTMDVTRRQLTNAEPGKVPLHGPMNTFVHAREYPDADVRVVVRPNFDTLYSSGWLDLTKGPVVVSAPDTGGRYYMLPMLDMWSNVFAAPGKRTTGTGAKNFVVVPPGKLFEFHLLPFELEMERIDAPTPYVWVIGRTQTNGPKDYPAVHQVQDGYKITPLEDWGKPARKPKTLIDPTVDMKTPPLDQVNAMPAAAYFAYAAELLELHPPQVTDQPILARMKRIGLVRGQPFDANAHGPAVKRALDRAAKDALKGMVDKAPTLARVVNGWQMNTDTMGVYGTYYLKRAIVAMMGLGANLPEDAIYPMNVADADGKPMDGGKNYVLHFAKAELPPADAFWSVTMYDAHGFQAANPLNRFAIGDRDALKYNDDGSLDIHIRHDSPGKDKESNWLPAPEGPLGVTMRLYAPRRAALDGRWAPPAIRRLP